jgi:WD40 repeat protein
VETRHGWAYAIALSDDTTKFATAGKDGIARVWDLKSGRLISELRGHSRGEMIYQVGWSGNRIITASQDGTARTWDAESGRQVSIIPGRAGRWVYSADISPRWNGSNETSRQDVVALAGEDGTVFLYGSEYLDTADKLTSVETKLGELTSLQKKTYLHNETRNKRCGVLLSWRFCLS